MEVFVDKTKCTGCDHCKDVCPVAVFEMYDKAAPEVNNDSAPENMKWKGTDDPNVVKEWSTVNDGHTHFKTKSVAINGPSCILCQACLIECEGACIHIKDDSGTTYQSTYK